MRSEHDARMTRRTARRLGAVRRALSGRLLSGREPQPGVGARAIRSVPHARLATVRGGDHVDDRQAQAAAMPGAARVRAAEALERVRQKDLRQTGAIVEDVQLDMAVGGVRAQRDRAGSVTQRIVDEVRQRLLDAGDVGRQQWVVTRLDGDPPAPLPGAHAEAAVDVLQQASGADPATIELQAPGIAGRDDQQILGELAEPIGLVADDAQRVAQRLGRVVGAQRDLDLGLEDGQRRPQLVAGVGDERSLALAGALEALEHAVQRYAETMDLVLGRRQRQARGRVDVGDPGGGAAHDLHRSQHGAGQAVAGHGGQHERQAAAHQQRAVEQLQRALALLQRCADDEHRRAAGNPTHEKALLFTAVDVAGGAARPSHLVAAQERGLVRSRRGDEHRAGRPEELCGEIAAGEQVASAPQPGNALLAQQRRDVGRACVERRVEAVVQAGLEMEVQKEPDRREHERDQPGVGERELGPDRKAG
jgi:hypothetical protein